jgi:hypothetical protein
MHDIDFGSIHQHVEDTNYQNYIADSNYIPNF